MKESKGIVYILTNPCLDGWVKIGMTECDDIQRRLYELNQPSNLPLSFRAYALYHVENPFYVEQHIHKLIDTIDDSLHAREVLASGKIREREFFQISPDTAFMIFKQVAALRGDSDRLELVEMSEEEQQEELVVHSRKPRLKFSMIDIPVGSELGYIDDDSVVCVTLDNDNHVLYEGERYTPSGLVKHLHGGKGDFAGTDWLTYGGVALSELRRRRELREAEEED